MYRHLLAAVDLGRGGECAALEAFRLARLLGSRVTLLHVVESPASRQAAARRLEALAAQARLRPGVRLESPLGGAAATVLRVAREVGADLILVGGEAAPGLLTASPEIGVHVVPLGGAPRRRGWGAALRR